MDVVDDSIERARSGDVEGAFHGLRELDHSTLPDMQLAYHDEDDPTVRAMIVEAIWQHRQPSVVGFLAEALQDPSSEVWKQALDGFVALANPEGLRVLQTAAARESDEQRRAWIDEAVKQVRVSLSHQA